MSYGSTYDERETKRQALAAELRECLRSNVKRPIARKMLARRWGVSFWTLTNWHRDRLKDLRSSVRDKIEAGIVRELAAEIERLQHEYEMAVRRDCGMAGDATFAQAIARAKALIEGRGQ